MRQIKSDGLYTLAEVRDVLNVGSRTVRRYIEDGGLPIIEVSNRRKYVLGSELRRWLLDQQRQVANR